MQFQLTGLPVAYHFVRRDFEMEVIERHILPIKAQTRRKIFILYSLGGTGKTQLAIAYARKYQYIQSTILQVNGNSIDTVLQSLFAFGRRTGVNSSLEPITNAAQQAPDIEAEAAIMLRWLALKGNYRQLIIINNIDRNIRSSGEDTQAFNIILFLLPVDYGSVLITTRLFSLKETASRRKLGASSWIRYKSFSAITRVCIQQTIIR